LRIYRTGIITFGGSVLNIDSDINGVDGKTCIMKYENGELTQKRIVTCHPNIVRGILTVKKGWGLWVNEWSDGIIEGSFTKQEILNDFKIKNIELPESFILEFDNSIKRKIKQKYGAIV
jgi:hypothetical protein